MREFDCSVVIPAYNAEGTVAGTIRSVLAQRLPCREVIVVDDGSTDHTQAVARAVPGAGVRVLSRPNGGPSAAKNAGVAAARGRYIAFLDSDDLWLPTYTEAISAALRQAPAAGLAYTDAWVFDAATRRVRRSTAMNAPVPPPPHGPDFIAELLRYNFIFTSATVPAAVLDHVGGFSEERIRAEEYELWLRIVLAGYPAVYAGGPLALYRHHPGQLSSAALEMTTAVASVLTDLPEEELSTESLRHLLNQRRRSAARSVRAVSGEDRMRAARLRLRRRLGMVRRRIGLSQRWYDVPPALAAEALALLDPPPVRSKARATRICPRAKVRTRLPADPRATPRPEGLIVAPTFPFPPDSGGAKRTLRLLDAAQRAGVVPRLVTWDRVSDDRRRSLTDRGWLVDEVAADDLDSIRSAVLTHGRLDPGRHSPRVARAVRTAIGPSTAFVQAEHPLSAPYLRGLPPTPVVLSTHNVDSRLQRQAVADLRAWDPVHVQGRYRAIRLARAERMGSLAGTVLAVSEADAAYFRRFTGRVIVAPNGVDDVFFDALAAPSHAPYVAFFGLMTYAPNRDGIRRFVAEGWPRLSARNPDLRLVIAGRGSREVCGDLAADERISVLGLVDDLAGLTRGAAAILVPIWAGGGTRLKVLEALATGQPVVGTGLGVSGIGFRDGEHGLIADTPAALADALGSVVDDRMRAARLGAAGRQLAERYRWPLALADVEALYRRLAIRRQERSGTSAMRIVP